MKERTIRDLALLKELHYKKSEIEKEISELKQWCEHLDYKVEYVETLKFDLCPKAICVVCGKRLDYEPSFREKLDLLTTYVEDAERKFTEDLIPKMLDGFNHDVLGTLK